MKNFLIIFAVALLTFPHVSYSGLKTSSEENEKNRKKEQDQISRSIQDTQNLEEIREINFDQNKLLVSLIEENIALKRSIEELNGKMERNNKLLADFLSEMGNR